MTHIASRSFGPGGSGSSAPSLVLDIGNSPVANTYRMWDSLPEDEKIQRSGCCLECLAFRTCTSGGRDYLFRAKEGLDRDASADDKRVEERLDRLMRKTYPAIEGPMDPKSLPPRGEGSILSSLGYHSFKSDQRSYFVYPDREALLARWEVIRKDPYHPFYKPGLPEMRVGDSEGVASDREFVESYLKWDALLSREREFVHDQDYHVGSVFHFAGETPGLYRAYRDWHKRIIGRIVNRLEDVASRGAESKYLEEMWLMLGTFVDFRSSHYSSNKPNSWVADWWIQASENMHYIHFWKRRMGEYPDIYRLEGEWKALLQDSLSPEEFSSDYPRPGGSWAMGAAAQKGESEFLEFLLKKKNPEKAIGGLALSGRELRWTPLFAAAQRGHLDCVNLLLEYGEDPNGLSSDRYSATALMVAAELGQDACVERLLSAGADPALESTSGCLALQLAAKYGRSGALRLLLENGANVDQISCVHGAAALFTAADFGRPESLRILLEYGARVDQLNFTTGTTPLFTAVEQGYVECVRILLEHGADPRKICWEGTCTPLMVAAKEGHEELVKLLLQYGADPAEMGSGKSLSARKQALKNGHHRCVEIMDAHMESRDSMAGIEEHVD